MSHATSPSVTAASIGSVGRDRESKQVASYAGVRTDVLRHVGSPATVLDVGCNEGATIRELKRRLPNVKCWGIDINPDAVARAGDVLEAGYCVNLDQTSDLVAALEGLRFDTIMAADVLEHTIDPWRVFRTLGSHLNDGGHCLISLPNLGHWETLLHFLSQRLPRRPRGLYDDTHLRFFMRRNLNEFEVDGFCVSIVQRNFRLWERRQTPLDSVLGATLGWVPWLRDFFVFQYIIHVAKVAGR